MKKLIIIIENKYSYLFSYFNKNYKKIVSKHCLSINSTYDLFDEIKIDSGTLYNFIEKHEINE
jgi:hypothetical protein